MQPGQAQDTGFQPKYRHFNQLDRVWVKNPFQEDIVYQVADEHNRPYKYRLPAGKVSELPGGTIATLGVKNIVDRLIQEHDKDVNLMWDPRVRGKHEESVIVQVKATTLRDDSEHPGEINLGSSDSDLPKQQETVAAPEPESEFPGLNEPAQTVDDGRLAQPPQQQMPENVRQGISDVVGASLPSTNTTLNIGD